MEALQPVDQHGAVLLVHHLIAKLDDVVGRDPQQVRVEGGVVECAQGQAVGNHWGTSWLNGTSARRRGLKIPCRETSETRWPSKMNPACRRSRRSEPSSPARRTCSSRKAKAASRTRVSRSGICRAVMITPRAARRKPGSRREAGGAFAERSRSFNPLFGLLSFASVHSRAGCFLSLLATAKSDRKSAVLGNL